MANFGDVFTNASLFCVPVPLERYEKPKPEKRSKAQHAHASASTSTIFSTIASTITSTINSPSTSTSTSTCTSTTASSAGPTSSAAQTSNSQTPSRLWTHFERFTTRSSSADANSIASSTSTSSTFTSSTSPRTSIATSTSTSTVTATANTSTSAHASRSPGPQEQDSGATSPCTCTETSGSHFRLYQCPSTASASTSATSTTSSTGTGNRTGTSWSTGLTRTCTSTGGGRNSSSAPRSSWDCDFQFPPPAVPPLPPPPPPPPPSAPSAPSAIHLQSVQPVVVPASPDPLQEVGAGTSTSTDAAGGGTETECACTSTDTCSDIGRTGMSLLQLNSPAAATPTSAAFAEAEVVDLDTAAGYSSDNNLNLSHSATSTGTGTGSSSSPAPPHTCTAHTAHTAPSKSAVAAVAASAKATKAAASRLSRRIHLVRPADGLFSIDLKNASSHVNEDASRSSTFKQMNGLLHRPETSSTNTNTSTSARTMNSLDPSIAGDSANSRMFMQRNGRTYFSDPTNPYPLPLDLAEIHRQTLRTLMLIQVFGAPIISPSLIKKPPLRVLEMGCSSGFWSMMCHQFFKARGHSGISFTGIDIAPLAPDSGPGLGADSMKPDSDMNWTFIQHDLRQWPWPLPTEGFDLIVSKDMSFFATESLHIHILAEFNRILKPGGVLEIWDSDYLIRMLRPHVPVALTAEEAEEQLVASSLGIYVINANTPFSAPLNPYLVEYNQWLLSALQSRALSAVPCALVASILFQETETLGDLRTRRLAIPLSDIRWEREGVGGVITKDGKPNVESKGSEQEGAKVEKKGLSAGQLALRQTAMLTVMQQVQALEPMLREVSGKSQDEWDVWIGKMMGDMLSEGGASWGECLEIGVWSVVKRVPASTST